MAGIRSSWIGHRIGQPHHKCDGMCQSLMTDYIMTLQVKPEGAATACTVLCYWSFHAESAKSLRFAIFRLPSG
jgi:hypothetical protein